MMELEVRPVVITSTIIFIRRILSEKGEWGDACWNTCATSRIPGVFRHYGTVLGKNGLQLVNYGVINSCWGVDVTICNGSILVYLSKFLAVQYRLIPPVHLVAMAVGRECEVKTIFPLQALLNISLEWNDCEFF